MYVELEIFSQDIIINQIPTTSNPTIVEFFLNNYIKLNWKGNWVAGQYLVNDSVRYNGAVWAAKKNTTDTPSISSEDWGLMVIDGEDGVGVTNIELIETIDLVDHYRMHFSDDSHFDYYLKNGEKGDTGVGIFNIQEAIPLPGVHVIRITLTDTSWYEFTIIDGKDGENGQNPEFRINDTHIQWKLVNEISWINLIALEALRGPSGKNVELSKNSTHLLWRLVGDTEWQTLIALSLITGPAGKSAYEQAQEGGYTGTLQEFISFLNGSYSPSNHNHNLNDLTEKSYNSLSDKPNLSSLHSHPNKTALDNYNPENFAVVNHNHDTQYEQKNSNIQSHISSTNNPHSTTKNQVGLGNVDNTSDADKPLSNAETNALSGKVDKETGKGLSQENYTTEEKTKLASLAPDKWLGEFPSLLALQTAHPVGIPGNSAYVDLGEGVPVATYAWDSSDQSWVKQQGDTTAETPESVKQKYESNPDTNAFTDAEKTKLSGISSGADVTKDVLTSATTNNTIDDSDTFNFTKLIAGVPTLLKSTFAYIKNWISNSFLKLDQTTPQATVGTFTFPIIKANSADITGSLTADVINSIVGYNINRVTAPTIPTATAVAGTGLSIGTYYYFITYTTAIGETDAGAIATVITTAGNEKVELTNIPISTDPRVTGRKIYRTKVGQTSDAEYYLATLANNTTTTYTDTTPDASLTGLSLQRYKVNTTSKQITIDGLRALFIDNNLTALGINAAISIIATSGAAIRSVFVGASAGRMVTTGQANTVVGGLAFSNATTAGNCTLVGDLAGASITIGSSNTAMGGQAGRNLTIGLGNTFIGTSSGSFLNDGTTPLTAPTNGVYIGRETRGFSTTEDNAIVIGYRALSKGSNTVTIGNSSVTNTYLQGVVSCTKGVVIGDNTDVASYDNRGATRYRENAGGSFYEMVMKQTDGSYAWQSIVFNQ